MLPYEVLTLEGITPLGALIFIIAVLTILGYAVIKWWQAETKVKQTSVENEKLRTEGDNKIQSELIGLFRDTVGGIQDLSKSIRDSHDGAEKRANETAEKNTETTRKHAEILEKLSNVAAENNGLLKSFQTTITDLSETAHETKHILQEKFMLEIDKEMKRIEKELREAVMNAISEGLKNGMAEIESKLPAAIRGIVQTAFDKELPPIVKELVRKELLEQLPKLDKE